MTVKDWEGRALDQTLWDSMGKAWGYMGVLAGNPPVIVTAGSTAGNIAPGVSQVAKIYWAEPVKGTATVRDGSGNVVAQLTYAGSGPEPEQIFFNPPLRVNGISTSAPGGILYVYCQGFSSSGY
jgi:hypothetical protein